MDPSKSPSAPPQEYAAEKSYTGQVPPPAYHDNPGYPQFGPGYPPHPQGFGPPPPYGLAEYGQQPYPMGHQYPAQQAAVTDQPTMYVTRGPLAEPVNDYLCYSIFTMLCCFLPLGIAALIYSIFAREANHSGDQITAERCSRIARTLNHVALGLGIGALVLFIVYAVVLVAVSS
ncbi:proline-rich transmembrane protein 1-like [Xiphias gladius]|uniref:proline-rich transmembrane protein 1-like n=1 Tax=Xiphias gladius TaxID=8245 RepID=UPI001A9A2402|nr:proline-rich transmembrane protein 1-like [Xiphias gladius]XP_039972807.1 proline-rich transmembrane protein 1-like [Xiphias gladius]